MSFYALTTPIKSNLKRNGFIHLRNMFCPHRLEATRVREISIGQEMGFLIKSSKKAILKKGRLHVPEKDQHIFAYHLKKSAEYKTLLSDPVLKSNLNSVFGLWRFLDKSSKSDGLWARFVAPAIQNPTLPPHQDAVYHGAEKKVFGIWFPLEECPKSLGGLCVLPKSHRHGLLTHKDGFLNTKISTNWYIPNYKSGDCIVFSNLCIHGPLPNKTERQVRLSIDCRIEVRGAGTSLIRP